MIIYFTPSSQILVFSVFDFKSLLIQNEKNGIYFNLNIFFCSLDYKWAWVFTPQNYQPCVN